MSGHMLFASLMTAYILFGLWFEERALLRDFGDAYGDHQRNAPLLIPGLKGVFRPLGGKANLVPVQVPDIGREAWSTLLWFALACSAKLYG